MEERGGENIREGPDPVKAGDGNCRDQWGFSKEQISKLSQKMTESLKYNNSNIWKFQNKFGLPHLIW